jgi:hypothetical protein
MNIIDNIDKIVRTQADIPLRGKLVFYIILNGVIIDDCKGVLTRNQLLEQYRTSHGARDSDGASLHDYVSWTINPTSEMLDDYKGA